MGREVAAPPVGGRSWRGSLRGSWRLLSPRRMARNPVLFVVEIGAVMTLLLTVEAARSGGAWGYPAAVTVLLAATVWLAAFAEAIAEAQGQAQAASLRATRSTTQARRLVGAGEEVVASTALRPGDRVVVAAGEIVPADGEIVEGAASIDESAVTGESAPVFREAGTDKSGVTGGTRLLSDRVVVEVTVEPGDSFLDRMIRMVEGATRQKTPNEIALSILLSALTLVFLVVCVTLPPLAASVGVEIDRTTLVALFVCLIPTTIGGLLPAIGIAGMNRALAANVVARSGKAVEVAGDIDVLLLDKTGTITVGARQATRFHPAPGVSERQLAMAAALASRADPTPEGRSIVALAERMGVALPAEAGRFVPFSAQARMSGVDLDGRRIRKGAPSRMTAWLAEGGVAVPDAVRQVVETVARGGGTPLIVVDEMTLLGVVALTDVLKPGIAERFARLRAMGIETVMITGDNPLTAGAIAAEAGVDSFLAEATPEDKLARIRAEQAKGRLVAMVGDGTNDAPALAQADLGLAMNAGTQAAREAGNMVDLDSDPTKLLDVVEIGKQLLVTRGALTTFSVANDVAKYFAILPALFVGSMPALAALDVMGLSSPRSAILAAVVFNALVIPALVPLALRGVRVRPASADRLLARNLLVYGVGGLLAPFVGIKLIDVFIAALGVA
ncbi:MAG: potassium-transporting ATPase subunit KdpB [Myxococcales bacterium]|nr:potassium-transporting ATPase subunit KdpB [Myxococcales bacterium]MCB9552285.1 potassium-transporting ATPase subunit KdpB [Myxococcales bacterium]